MKKINCFKTGGILFILFLMLICAVLIYPLRKIPLLPYESSYGGDEIFGTGNISAGKQVTQSFRAEPGILKSISIYMQNLQQERGGMLSVTVRQEGEELKKRLIPLKEIPNYVWYPVELGIWLEAGVYTVDIAAHAEDVEILQTFATAPENAPKENLEYWYCGEKQENLGLAVNYEYIMAAKNRQEAVPFIFIDLLLGGIMIEIFICICRLIGRIKERKNVE